MSDDFPAFDLETTPLSGGLSLIEASAGTGKTFTIAGLVERLILGRGLAVNQILVTTFTELATAELRSRIRKRMRETLAAISKPDAEALPENWPDRDEAKRRLDLAIRNFDEAPICTIHGFCQRMLRDRAFESGTLFNAELISDESEILQEITDDFWRKNFYEADATALASAARSNLSPESLLKLLRKVKSNPDSRILPETTPADLAIATQTLTDRWEELGRNWSGWETKIRKIFQNAPWARYSQSKPATMGSYIDELAGCVENPSGSKNLVKALQYLSKTSIKKGTKNGGETPEHPLFDLCDELLPLEESFATTVKAAFCEWARSELPRRKQSRNILSFDDLLVRLRDALAAPDGDTLAASIRKRFQAALLDEFQDTDPVQEEIFRRIYHGSDAPVYLIGDPKQAIYGFRGADVFAYLEAAASATSKYTLGQNWRSETSLVEAVNDVFKIREAPFVVDGIAFRPVLPTGDADKEPLTVNGSKERPFRIWMIPSEKPLNNSIKHKIATATAGEIARLLDSPAEIGSARVEPGNIAVLVSTRWEARMVQSALAALRVPSAISGAAKVFESHEAGELLRILIAAAEPNREDRVRSALTTDILGLTANDLDALTSDDSAWDRALDDFSSYHALWKSESFIVMLRMLFVKRGVRERLLALEDGERRLTNLLHLSELLQAACVEQRLGIGGALKWFGIQIRDAGSTRDENAELRLERDDAAVRILTVHASKGLEFDVVYCPFVWGSGKASPKDQAAFHDRADGNRLTFALGASAAEHAEAAAEERLAEQVRLLYVALTRAKHRCTMLWGNFKEGKHSGPARLFEETAPDVLAEGTSPVSVEPLPDTPAPRYTPSTSDSGDLKGRPFSGTIDRTWGISSFTGLTRDHAPEPEAPEFADNEPGEPLPETEPLAGIAAFPRGAKPGTCLHEIFETLDFTEDTTIPEIVKRKLQAFSIVGNDEVVAEAVRRTLAVSLDGQDPEFTLSRIGLPSRLTELEFHFPVTDLTAERLSAFPGGGWRLAFHRMNGFLKGFIDLVFERGGKFHIVDWKSNWLGPTPDRYTPEIMTAEMHRQNYRLQLHLYTVALHRYLALRLPGYDYEEHFGGVLYVFVRGIDPARPELGLYRERPEADCIEELSELFKGGE